MKRRNLLKGLSLGTLGAVVPVSFAELIAMEIIFFTAGSCSLNSSLTVEESLSSPRVSWVKSLEPMENPLNIFHLLTGPYLV